MHKTELKYLADPTLEWLKQSFDACEGKGSAAWYSRLRRPLNGWSEAYPETTGYIIETLLDYHEICQECWMKNYALAAADWLVSIQKPDGSFPAGLGTKGSPSVFNSGMILFGLERSFVFTGDQKYFDAAKKTADWLCGNLDLEGKWTIGAYVEGYVPSYYTRVIWAVLLLNRHNRNQDTERKMNLAYNFYCDKFADKNADWDWSFAPGKPAFTHTIAYTMRGFLESATLLKDSRGLLIAKDIAEQFINELQKNGDVAGSYDEDFKGDYSFVCVTGNAQLSINFYRLFQLTGEEKYKMFSKRLFETVREAPSRIPISGLRGGIPGSFPIIGKYMPLQRVNWGAKFWLDAARLVSES